MTRIATLLQRSSKRILIFAYCRGWLPLHLTGRLFELLKLSEA